MIWAATQATDRKRPPFPWLTVLLIGVNLAAAFWVVLDPSVLDRLGLRADRFSLLALVTGVFLHVNVLHLLGNMVFLAACGPSVEAAARGWRLLVAYLAGGVAGGLLHVLMAGTSATQPLVGASGAVAAVIGYFAVSHHALRVPLAPNLTVPISAVVGLWVALQALGAFVALDRSAGGAAFWAHLGGLAAGLLLSLIFRAPSQAQVIVGRAAIKDMSRRSPAAALAAAEAHLRRHPSDRTALRVLAEAQRALGDATHEAGTLLSLLRAGDPETAIPRLAELGALQRAPSVERARLAEALKATRPDLATALLTSVVQGDPADTQRPDALLALATLRKGTDPAEAERLARALLDEFPLHPAAEVARARGLDQ